MRAFVGLFTLCFMMCFSAQAKLDCSGDPLSRYNYKISLTPSSNGHFFINRTVGDKQASSLLDDTGYLTSFYIKEYLMRADNDSSVNSGKYGKSIRLMRLQLAKLKRAFAEHKDTAPSMLKAIADVDVLLNESQIDKGQLYMKWMALDKALVAGENIEALTFSRAGEKHIKERTGLRKISQIEGLPFESGKNSSCAITVSSFDPGKALDVALENASKTNEGLRQNSDDFFKTSSSKNMKATK